MMKSCDLRVKQIKNKTNDVSKAIAQQEVLKTVNLLKIINHQEGHQDRLSVGILYIFAEKITAVLLNVFK